MPHQAKQYYANTWSMRNSCATHCCPKWTFCPKYLHVNEHRSTQGHCRYEQRVSLLWSWSSYALPSSEVTPITITRKEQHSETLRLIAAPSATIVARSNKSNDIILYPRHSQDAARCCEGLEVRGNFSCALVAVVIFLGGDIIFVQGNSSTIDLCQVLRILFAEKLLLTLSTETLNLHLSLKKIR